MDRAPRPAAPGGPVESAGAWLQVRNLHKQFGATPVLRDVSFEIAEGEFVCFLGPSGCGKTTLLLCLAGMEHADSGRILKQGQSIGHLPPSRRDVGIVFQSYALFPNLTVYDNVAFGLVSQRQPDAEIRKSVADLVALLSLQGHEDKYPSQLSGGQQQRVALARSLALSPSLLLLDEPLSALDAQVRVRLRTELRELQTRLGLTTIMVTHDQEEAQSLADRIVLMNSGRIEQVGTPWEIYNQPKSAFVADFIGIANLHEGRAVADGVDVHGAVVKCAAHGLATGSEVRMMVRPEDVELSVTRTANTNAIASGVVTQVEHLGGVVRAHLAVAQGPRWVADVTKKDFMRAGFEVGATLWIGADAADVKVFAK